MDKIKETEELADLIYYNSDVDMYPADSKSIAYDIISKGYRRADIVEKEIAQKILSIIKDRLNSVEIYAERMGGYETGAFGYDVEQVDKILIDLTKQYEE